MPGKEGLATACDPCKIHVFSPYRAGFEENILLQGSFEEKYFLTGKRPNRTRETQVYENLYGALFNKPDQYLKIVEALSKKGITRDEICRKTGIASSGELTKKLKELENCGFIRKYVPFGFKGQKRSDH